jgi:FkbM family methyltransferase
LKKLLAILRFINAHPLASKNKLAAYRRFFSWQLSQLLNPGPVIYTVTGQSRIWVEKGMAGATGNIYTGLLEFEEMMFTLHLLRPGDLFGDIGANVGIYMVLAAKNAQADVVAVEPIPSTFEKLKKNIVLNGIEHKVQVYAGGVGQESGYLAFTQSADTVNHVAGVMELMERDDIVSIPVKTIDEIFAVKNPVLLKMDIEGFEWPALLGASQTLNNHSLKGIIIELNGSGKRYNYIDDDIDKLLREKNFLPFSYKPFERNLVPLKKYNSINTIYIRDIDWVKERLRKSASYKITGIDI